METVKILEEKGDQEKNKILGKHFLVLLMSKNIDFEIGELYYLQHSSSKCDPVVTTTTTPVSSSSLVCVSQSHTPVIMSIFCLLQYSCFGICGNCFIVNVNNVDLKHLSGTGNSSVYVAGRM